MGAKRYSFIDSHVHSDELVDLEGAIRRTQSAGIKAIIAVGSDLISNDKVLKIAQTVFVYLFPSLGFHPWKIKSGLGGGFYEPCSIDEPILCIYNNVLW
jgi:Tat protein secretion system quality control protein TatD with DNase activity